MGGCNSKQAGGELNVEGSRASLQIVSLQPALYTATAEQHWSIFPQVEGGGGSVMANGLSKAMCPLFHTDTA